MASLRRPLVLLTAAATAIAVLAAAPAVAEAPDGASTAAGDQPGVAWVADDLRSALAHPTASAAATVVTWDRAGLDAVEAAGVDGVRLRVLPMLLVESLTASQLAVLEALPAVRSVVGNWTAELHMEETLYLTGARAVWAGAGVPGGGVTGAGVELAILDSGVFGQHPDTTNLIEFCDTVHAVSGSRLMLRCSPYRPETGNAGPAGEPPTDDPRQAAKEDTHHGSHVLGTIAGTGAASGGPAHPHSVVGMSPEAKVRFYNASVGPTLQAHQIMAAFDDLIWKKLHGFNDVVAVNNSWGGGEGEDYNPDSDQAVAFKAAYDAGILPVFSAGNDGPGHNTLGVQCTSPWVLCVGATTKPDSMAGFSSVGRPSGPADTNGDGIVGGEGDIAPDNHDRRLAQALDIGLYRPGMTGPGVDIMSLSWYDGLCTSPDAGRESCYTRLSGTSMSAPHVTGAVGLVAQAFRDSHRRTPTPAELIDIFERSSVHLPGVPAEAQGAGRLDARRAVTLARTYPEGRPLTIGSPLPRFAPGAHPGAPGTVVATQTGCTEPESWTRGDGWGQHRVPVPDLAERIRVTLSWEQQPGANLYLRVWRPGVDPDGLAAPPGPDRVFPDGENAGLVFVGIDNDEFDGTQRQITLRMPEPGEWVVRVYHRSSPGPPRDCAGDSQEQPKRSSGFNYTLQVEAPQYVEPPDVALHGDAPSATTQRLHGTAGYPRGVEGITNWGVPGTGVGADGVADPAGVRVVDRTFGLRVAWNDPTQPGSFQIHRSTDPTFTPSPATMIHTGPGTPCVAPASAGWPSVDRAGLCYDDTTVQPRVTYYYRVLAMREGSAPGSSLLAQGRITPLEDQRAVRVRLDRIFGRGYWEFAEPTNPAVTTWEHLWDRTGTREPSPPIARSYQQGVGSPPAAETPEPPTTAQVGRVAGATRISTAVEVSRSRYPDGGADAVVLARADDYPDALAGAPLARRLDAPLLLTWRNRLDSATTTEIHRLGARRVVMLGGTAALSPAVAAGLRAAGVEEVERVDGRNRFHTAELVARRLGDRHPVAFVAAGGHPDPARGWPDALAASAYAAHTGRPILLVTHGTVPDETRRALRELAVAESIVVGGSAAVSEAVTARMSAAGHGPRRLAGPTRYATSVAVYREAVQAGLDADHLWLATGNNWPDALAAGPTVAAFGHSLVLVDGIELDRSAATRNLLRERRGTIRVVRLLGGTAAISVITQGQIEAVLGVR